MTNTSIGSISLGCPPTPVWQVTESSSSSWVGLTYQSPFRITRWANVLDLFIFTSVVPHFSAQFFLVSSFLHRSPISMKGFLKGVTLSLRGERHTLYLGCFQTLNFTIWWCSEGLYIVTKIISFEFSDVYSYPCLLGCPIFMSDFTSLSLSTSLVSSACRSWCSPQGVWQSAASLTLPAPLPLPDWFKFSTPVW